MATLNDLKKSISEISKNEAFQLIMNIRANRRIKKKNFFKQVKERKPKQITLDQIKSISIEEKFELLKLLQGG